VVFSCGKKWLCKSDLRSKARQINFKLSDIKKVVAKGTENMHNHFEEKMNTLDKTVRLLALAMGKDLEKL